MHRNKRILIVDDDQDVLLGVSTRLKAAGYKTMTEANGAAAVATATKTTPDAIVMDLRLPEQDGIAAIEELRSSAETRGIPIVMLSASLRDQQRALDAGARFFLAKPYHGSKLVDAVDSAVNEAADQKKEKAR